MVVTVIYHLLREFMKDNHGKLPRRLHLNLGKIRNKIITVIINLQDAVLQNMDTIKYLRVFLSSRQLLP